MWYAIVRNQQIGPVSAGAIAELIRVGVADGQTYAWADGMGDWKPLSELPDFIPVLNGEPLRVSDGDAREADEHASTLMMSSDQAQAWAEVLNHLPELASSAAAAQHATAEPDPDESLAGDDAFADGHTVLEIPGLIPELEHRRQNPPLDAQGTPSLSGPPSIPPFDPNPEPAPAPEPPPPVDAPLDLAGPPDLSAPPELQAPAEWAPETVADVPALSPEEQDDEEEDSGGGGKMVLLLVLLVVLGAGGAIGVKMWMASDQGGTPDAALAEKPLLADMGAAVVAPVNGLMDAGTVPKPDAAAPAAADAATPAAADAGMPDAATPDAAPPAKPDAAPPAKPDASVKIVKNNTPPNRRNGGKSPIRRRKGKNTSGTGGSSGSSPIKDTPPKNNLPVVLSRNDIQKVMNANKPKLKACADPEGPQGSITVQVLIQRSGKVARARVTKSSVRGTPVGKCIEKTVKGIKFPEFSGNPMDIPLPPVEI
ncbi:MAG: GYF domain-containing protein [Bradymonadia bacterium]